MHLKRLELKGFKSFPTKTDIVFKEGITAIVGPNGSGKSNISDAVRWVLGEQSVKSLRGEKLEDVIFVGTDTKKPMNYCEVSLTIDNTDEKLDIDFSEVTIKRRAYRNGESEFFLNNKSCRLKDIKEILLDTGIGKDGYSIIEQGKVDEILSNNPLNKRKVFDEACGISKFRYKKTEAEKNLSSTKDDLERINDIYVEIENQLKPLYNQSQKAKNYLELSEKLKVIEVNSYIKEIESLENEIKEVQNHSKLLEEQSNEIEKQKNLIEKDLSNTNKEIEEMDENINKSIDYINSIKSVISQKDSQISLINERIKNCQNDLERKNVEVKSAQIKLEENKDTLENLNVKKQEEEEKISLVEEDLRKIDEKNSDKKEKISSLTNEIEFLKDEIINLLNTKQEYSNRLSTLLANSKNINSRTDNIDLEIDEIKKSIESKENDINNLKNEYNFNTKKVEQLKKEEKDISENLKIINKNISNIDEEIQNNKYKLNDYNSKLNIYKDMENHHEGFNKGVKEVLKNKNLSGIYGALGQIVSVSKEYEKAIEASLGAYMQNIITKDEFSAKEAINYLKKNNLGRVTFLPMNVIKSNKIDVKSLKLNFIGLASDLVSFDEKYRNIIENILGRTIIIDTIDNGIKFAKETNHKFKIVTLDGEILNPGGSLTGGSLKYSTNILSRKRLISEFSEKIEETKNNINQLMIKKNKLEEQIKNERKKLEEITLNIKSLDKELIIKNSDMQRVILENETLKNNIDKLEKEKLGLNTNLTYTTSKTEEVEKNINQIEEKSNNNREKIENLSKELKTFNDLYENDKDKFDKLNISLVKHNQIKNEIIKDINRINLESNDLKIRLENIEKSLKNQENESIKLSEEIVIEKNEKLNLEKQLNDSIRNLENKKAAKEGLKNVLDNFNKELKNSHRNFIELKESLFKVQSKLERLKSSNENYLNKLFEKYELTFLQALEIKNDNLTIDKKILDKLKKDISSLGNVNIDSIEEYKEVKERYDFYKEQKFDLEESIDAIENLIDELEENMKKEFELNFNAINENFKYVYKRLFGGGFGELIIVDKENILESDIEIIAQPPGKKMKNLNLLSGGEKALTAISILFSIILVKPTPFCILDEIEAPLDDANIVRFGEFLKELSKDTQFISVTHRRGTMAVADYIYGVTMQEKAISKVLSLKLQDANKIADLV